MRGNALQIAQDHQNPRKKQIVMRVVCGNAFKLW